MHRRVPSGIKLILEPDSECILRFIGRKDITEKVSKREDGSAAIVLAMYDGKRYVSMPCSFAFTEITLQEGFYYRIHHQGEVEMGPGRNPMKDLDIMELGVSGETVQVPRNVVESGELTLADETIAELNYTRFNYPLRAPSKVEAAERSNLADRGRAPAKRRSAAPAAEEGDR